LIIYNAFYKESIDVLKSIKNGKCRKNWIINFKNALKTKINPLNLNASERKNMTKKMQELKGKRSKTHTNKTLKNKYKIRNSTPYPANENCNKIMTGNDKNKYKSTPNKNGICTWKKIEFMLVL
jgi:hypothetical protein